MRNPIAARLVISTVAAIATGSALAADVRLTHDAGQAGLLLGISVLDQVILAHDGFVSLRAEGLYVPPPVRSIVNAE